ncbi:hypothetical protein [Urbifossiella limnaea]|uniref:Uncharacterized protein n=1 Tax=Urbifossiella limnaea TaxID=2528023 RepID=A0A517Y1Z6_9BACT|nr:hypothetical protein [Urbifossiella limnaea]QDU23754.1 hypothetical protein ETAA1_57610 [Urbifossiella limnaea]
MTPYRYTFDPAVPADELGDTLVLAVIAAEALHGESQTRLDAGHAVGDGGRVVVIDAGTAVGRDLNRLFVGFATREFGPDSFRVERAEPAPAARPEPAAA